MPRSPDAQKPRCPDIHQSRTALYSLKEVNLWYKKKYETTAIWPLELLLVALGIIFGSFLNLKENYNIGIVGEVPSGLPPIIIPDIIAVTDTSLIKGLLPDAFSTVLVAYSTGLSMGELFAAKYNYDLDANAEAHGLSFALFGNALVGGVGTGAALAPQRLGKGFEAVWAEFFFLKIFFFTFFQKKKPGDRPTPPR